jgi:CheY-like chemotaxis protein
VLDISKIESGRVVLEESEVDLRQLLHELQSSMGVAAAEKGLSFTVEPSPTLSRHIAVDAGKLRQVLVNLIGNATKYTESGGVKLRAEVVSWEPPQRARLRFEVEDSGPGISKEDQERVFFPFVRLGNGAPIEAGAGLGLAITKQYVELMGGKIGVASEPGKRSVFHFEIPVGVLPTVETPAESGRGRITGLAEGQPCLRILIAEDQRENRLLLRKFLEPLGFELREAVNGQEAVALFEEWRPHLIWMDLRMPVMDGLEAARRIKTTGAGNRTKIVALTAHALEDERKRILAAGCDDLVRKPYREDELFDVMARHLVQLQGYDWPGNVRELQNRIERALILAENGVMYFDLPTGEVPTGIATPAPAAGAPAGVVEVLSDIEFRQRERDNVLAALNKTGWKIHGPGGTAELLGLKPTTLISRYGHKSPLDRCVRRLSEIGGRWPPGRPGGRSAAGFAEELSPRSFAPPAALRERFERPSGQSVVRGWLGR